MFTYLAATYGIGFLLSKGVGNKTEDSLKWPIVLFRNINNKNKRIN